ncbi:hypothetical protein SAY86_022532 [Trapa natans]|uniref:Uncharacterized protein n=1 Tax=Trapa natans TaxID=22666 RepID=A0AAN7M5D3_TRANT|nr:hypothetical protein SAY86_022532 [Trapa natans]
MADPTPLTISRRAPKKPATLPSSRSSSGYLLKSLVCAIFLFALPILPSEAPAFVSGTPFTNLWEFLRILFFGIAVSYGLFSRRNAEKRNPTSELPETYLSRMEGLLSIFDDGCHENAQFQYRDDLQSQGEIFSLERNLKSKSYYSRNDSEIHGGHLENPEIHSWNSQYLQSPPMIVVARPNYSLDSDYKPLGLPIRSLRSRTAEPIGVKRTARGGLGSGAAGTANSSFISDGCKYGSFGEMDPLDSEEKFDGTVSSHYQIPRSTRLKSREGRRDSRPASLKQAPHSRHLSVEESQFRHHRSVRSKSFASHGNSVSSPSPSPQSSPGSATPELLEVSKEGAPEKKRSVGASMDDGAGMFFEPDSRHYTNRVSIENTMPKNPRCGKDYSENGIESMHYEGYTKHAQRFGNGQMDLTDEEKHHIPENKDGACESLLPNGCSDPFAFSNNHSNYEATRTSDRSSRIEERSNSSFGEGPVQGSMKLHVNPLGANSKPSFRGMSVRTFRSRDKSTESKTPRVIYPRKGEELGAFDDELAFSNGDVDGLYTSRPNTRNYPNHDEKKLQDRESMDTKEVEFQANKSDIDSGNDFEYISEVDKKATEFIAKFREQIRLQKTASIDSSSVIDVAEDHYN